MELNERFDVNKMWLLKTTSINQNPSKRLFYELFKTYHPSHEARTIIVRKNTIAFLCRIVYGCKQIVCVMNPANSTFVIAMNSVGYGYVMQCVVLSTRAATKSIKSALLSSRLGWAEHTI